MKNILSAIQVGDLQEVADKISNIKDLNAMFDGETMLTTAAMNGDADMVKFLIDSGCNPMVKNKKGKLPIDLAISTGKTSAYKVLIKTSAALKEEKPILNIPEAFFKEIHTDKSPYSQEFIDYFKVDSHKVIYFNNKPISRSDQSAFNSINDILHREVPTVNYHIDNRLVKFLGDARFVHLEDKILGDARFVHLEDKILLATGKENNFIHAVSYLIAPDMDLSLAKKLIDHLNNKNLNSLFNTILYSLRQESTSESDLKNKYTMVVKYILDHHIQNITPNKLLVIPDVLIRNNEILDKLLLLCDVKHTVLSKFLYELNFSYTQKYNSETYIDEFKESLDILMSKGAKLDLAVNVNEINWSNQRNIKEVYHLDTVDIVTAGLTNQLLNQFYCIHFEKFEAISSWLIDRGVDLHRLDSNGLSVLDLMLENNDSRKLQLTVIETLLDVGFKTDKAKFNEVIYASMKNESTPSIEKFSKQLQDSNMIDMVNDEQKTILMMAAENNDSQVVQALISANANPFIETLNHKNALALLGDNKFKKHADILSKELIVNQLVEHMDNYTPDTSSAKTTPKM